MTGRAWAAALAVAVAWPAAARAGRPPQIGVPPPPLGWSSWNAFGNDISQPVIALQADALARLDRRIADAADRYRYVDIDGGWWLAAKGGRTGSGGFAIDRAAWDGGSLAAVVRHIHGDGLRAGAYTDLGRTGCGGQNGSEGFYGPDMRRFAAWGFDAVKVDYCGGQAERLDPLAQYGALAQAIGGAMGGAGGGVRRGMLLSICDWGTVQEQAGLADSGEGPWSWAPFLGGLRLVTWRTSGDITDAVGASGRASFQEVLDNFHSSIHPQAQHTGAYNDPDMMVAGIAGLDDDPSDPVQSQAHLSLWAVGGAPMILGMDVAAMEAHDATLLGLVTNGEVIGVDQDARGLQGIEVAAPAAGVEVWAKLLSGSGRRAVVMLNTTGATVPVRVNAAELGLDGMAGVSVRDVWSHAAIRARGATLTLSVAPRSARMVVVRGTDLAPTRFGPVGAAGPGRTDFDLDGAAVRQGAGVFAMREGFDAIDIAYVNPGRATRYAAMTVGGQAATDVAFPPTGSGGGTVSVEARLTVEGGNLVSFSTRTGAAPALRSLWLAAGPVPVFAQRYPADAAGNRLTGAAVVQPCASCDDGSDVGFIGTGGGRSGTLTMNAITAARTGRYALLVGYTNGSGSAPATGAARRASVAVDGGTAVEVTFPVSGRDFDTVGVVALPVRLTAGRHSVSFANATGAAPDIVALDLAPASPD